MKTQEELTYLLVSADVRYWEDAEVNGIEDTNGDLIPFRKGDAWEPVIDLRSGRILDWPQGTTASIHYKVCDAGRYYLADKTMKPIRKYDSDYVPDDFLCYGDRGYGDYIIMQVSETGHISAWRRPTIKLDEWLHFYQP